MKTKKMHYLTPQTEIVLVEIAPLAAEVTSWNPDKGNAKDMLIIQGDPGGNGKGANGGNVWTEDDYTSHSLWDN